LEDQTVTKRVGDRDKRTENSIRKSIDKAGGSRIVEAKNRSTRGKKRRDPRARTKIQKDH